MIPIPLVNEPDEVVFSMFHLLLHSVPLFKTFKNHYYHFRKLREHLTDEQRHS